MENGLNSLGPTRVSSPQETQTPPASTKKTELKDKSASFQGRGIKKINTTVPLEKTGLRIRELRQRLFNEEIQPKISQPQEKQEKRKGLGESGRSYSHIVEKEPENQDQSVDQGPRESTSESTSTIEIQRQVEQESSVQQQNPELLSQLDTPQEQVKDLTTFRQKLEENPSPVEKATTVFTDVVIHPATRIEENTARLEEIRQQRTSYDSDSEIRKERTEGKKKNESDVISQKEDKSKERVKLQTPEEKALATVRSLLRGGKEEVESESKFKVEKKVAEEDKGPIFVMKESRLGRLKKALTHLGRKKTPKPEKEINLLGEPGSSKPLPTTESAEDEKKYNMQYAKELMTYQSTKNEPLTYQKIYEVLLRPGKVGKEFRQEFLLGGPQLDYARKDQANGSVNLVKEMIRLFNHVPSENELKEMTPEQAILKQRLIILRFAKKLIQGGLVEKQDMQPIMEIAEDIVHFAKMAEEEEAKGLNEQDPEIMQLAKKLNPDLVTFAKNLVETKNLTLEEARTINSQYKPHKTAKDLTEDFKRIGTGKISKQERSAIVKNFAKSLTTTAKNGMLAIRHTEFHKKGYLNAPKLEEGEKRVYNTAPNVLYMIERFNKTKDFIVNQIVYQENAENAARVYSAAISTIEELLALNNFNDAMAIFAALNSSSIDRMHLKISKEDQKRLEQISIRFSEKGNYKNLRAEMEKRRNEGIIPYMGNLVSDFTFIEDGNKEKEMVNFEKMELATKVHRFLEDAKTNLQRDKELEYDVETAITNGNFSEKEQYAKSLELVPKQPTKKASH
jgi:hypothetical protein